MPGLSGGAVDGLGRRESFEAVEEIVVAMFSEDVSEGGDHAATPHAALHHAAGHGAHGVGQAEVLHEEWLRDHGGAAVSVVEPLVMACGSEAAGDTGCQLKRGIQLGKAELLNETCPSQGGAMKPWSGV